MSIMTHEELRSLTPEQRYAIRQANREALRESLIESHSSLSKDAALQLKRRTKDRLPGMRVELFHRLATADHVQVPV